MSRGLILTNSKGIVAKNALHFLFRVTNNQSKYKALLARLKLTKALGVQCLGVFTDLQPVTGQVTDEFEARDPTMSKYLDKVWILTLML